MTTLERSIRPRRPIRDVRDVRQRPDAGLYAVTGSPGAEPLRMSYNGRGR